MAGRATDRLNRDTRTPRRTGGVLVRRGVGVLGQRSNVSNVLPFVVRTSNRSIWARVNGLPPCM
ncbi:hypothetical protein GCM10010404_11020 [Nonomuraea africana]